VQVSDKVWRGALYVAATVALVLGMVEAVRDAKLSDALSAGTPPPAFTATRMTDGTPFSLADVKGKVAVVSFWATWCGPCRRELPVLQKLEAQYRDRGLALVTVNMDDPDGRAEALAEWTREQGAAPPLVVLPGGETGRDWHAGTLPTLYVLGRDAQIVAGYSGAAPESTLRREIEAALKAL